MPTQKNDTLELLKLLASYMVVFIHVRFYGKLGTVAETLARFAVPFFFLISGFFSYKISPEKILKRIKHIALLLLFSVVLYTVFNVAVLLFSGDIRGIISYFSNYLNIKNLLKIFVFNVSFCALHLWYLYASLYVYIIFYFATVLRIKEKFIFFFSLSLLAVRLILGEGFSILGIAAPDSLIRNFALTGVPCFSLGLLAKKYEAKLRNVPNFILFIMIAAGAAESLLFRFFIKLNELYIGSLLILFAIVVIFIKYANITYPRSLKVLDGCSTYIYIYHIMVAQVAVIIYGLFHLDPSTSVLLKNIHPLVVCAVSTLLAYLTVKVEKEVAKQ